MAIISMVFTGPCQMLQDVDDDAYGEKYFFLQKKVTFFCKKK